ncbi:MAG TPA: 30S ribosomal protein S8 [Patescibacteria group bacterium]|nr:30S ribosomal protein S8 [Patescibacteria group bacterium]
MMTDPIADMLTRIRNAQMAHRAHVSIPASKLKKGIAELLSREGYVGKVEEKKDEKGPVLEVELKYNNRQPMIRSLDRVSKPGRRVYIKAESMPKVLNDYGVAILSTSVGLMTNKQARRQGVGGELICTVY